MTRITTPLAVGAETHDALVSARRAKNWMFLLLALGLIAQITIFVLARTNVVKIGEGGKATIATPDVDVTQTTTTAPTTSPGDPVEKDTDTDVTVERKDVTLAGGVLAWFINSIVFLGTVLSIVMSVVILLIVLVMLVGRLMGVSYATSAYIWAVLLAVLLFPWQLFYGPETARTATAQTKLEYNVDIDDYRIPGALYTWGELVQGVQSFPAFEEGKRGVVILRYARFVGYPLFALIILFMAQAKSGRGVKYALGEMDVQVEVAAGT